MTIDAKEALRRLGISENVLLPKEDILYDELVKQCLTSSTIPTIGKVASAVNISAGSYMRLIRILIGQGRAIKISLGRYVPVVEDDDVIG